jgi:hypothetical protein
VKNALDHAFPKCARPGWIMRPAATILIWVCTIKIIQYLRQLDFIFCWPCISVHFLSITNLTHFLIYLFISLLYMFRATQCSSSGDSIVSIHHLVCITLCRWRAWYAGLDLRTRQSPTLSAIYQMMYWYKLFSWWWALGCSKHVEKWNQ